VRYFLNPETEILLFDEVEIITGSAPNGAAEGDNAMSVLGRSSAKVSTDINDANILKEPLIKYRLSA